MNHAGPEKVIKDYYLARGIIVAASREH